MERQNLHDLLRRRLTELVAEMEAEFPQVDFTPLRQRLEALLAEMRP